MAMTPYTPRPHEDYIEWIDQQVEVLNLDINNLGATKKLLADYDKSLREQIAREIMASNVNVFMTTPETIRAHYAAIARGVK